MPFLVHFSKLTREEQLKEPKTEPEPNSLKEEYINYSNWNHIRARIEIENNMHPCEMFSTDVENDYYVIKNHENWKTIGFAVGFLLTNRPFHGRFISGGDKDWWFLKYPMIPSDTILEENDKVLIFLLKMYEPPLTTSYSKTPTLNEMKLSIFKKLWLPRDMVPGDLEDDSYFANFYDSGTFEEHYTDSKLNYIFEYPFAISFGVFRDPQAEEYLRSKSKYYFLPPVIMTKRT